MYDLFFRKLNELEPLSDKELDLMSSSLTTKKLRRKQYLLQEGDVCKYIAFVESGALKSYSIDAKGGEHILQFALEGWIISDLYSFLTGEPSSYHIQALEDCQLVLISQQAHEELLQQVPTYETYIRLQITNAYIALQKRLNFVQSLNAEERYKNLLALQPGIVQRVPQHMIASYMGLTPETLSRIRRKISDQQ